MRHAMMTGPDMMRKHKIVFSVRIIEMMGMWRWRFWWWEYLGLVFPSGLLLMCVFSSPGLLPDGESSIDRQLKATDSQLARVRFSHISCDFVVVCVMKYWFWFLFSVIQTVFNTFLSMLDRRFHGMIKVKNPQSMRCTINSFQNMVSNHLVSDHQSLWIFMVPSKVIPNSGQKETLKDMMGEFYMFRFRQFNSFV